MGNPNLVGIRFQWDPDMIHFTANHDETVLSTSYWQQYLFGRYRGSHTLPITNTNGNFNPLFWAASIDNITNTVFFKVSFPLVLPFSVSLSPPKRQALLDAIMTDEYTILQIINSAATPQSINLTLPEFSTVNGTILTHSDVNAFNSLANRTVIKPEPLENPWRVGEGRLEWEVRGFSINVLEFELK